MKSLSGNPELPALNEDLVVGKNTGMLGSVVLDDCNFTRECIWMVRTAKHAFST